MTDTLNKRILLVDAEGAIHQDLHGMLCADRDEREAGQEGVPPSVESLQLEAISSITEARVRMRKALRENRPYLAAVVRLIDVGWPDGAQALRDFLNDDPELPLLLCTPDGFSVADRREIVRRLGRTDGFLFLAEPVHRDDLLRLLACQVDSRLARQELRQAVDALDAAQRALELMRRDVKLANRAKNEFMANVSHEIRTPMNAVLGFTRLLMKEPLAAAHKEKLRYVDDAGTALLELINNMLDFSRLAAGQLELCPCPFHLDDLIREVIETTRRGACNKRIAMQCHVAANVPRRLIGDKDRFRQVLANLVGNAVKFTKEGSIHLRIVLDEQTERAAVLRAVVTDTGVGIAPDRQSLLFDSFAQADGSSTREFGGLGLGLAICKHLVHLMDGQIGLHSAPGQGSSFWMTVTLKKQHGSDPAGDTEALCEETPGGYYDALTETQVKKPRILVAEDDYLNRTFAEMLLGRAGFIIDMAVTGREALALLERTRYDLVLMDVEMPEMDGLEAIEQIRRMETTLLRHTPIVALTAHAMFEDRERCLAAGADEYLTKPIDPEKLLEVVQRHVPDCSGQFEPEAGTAPEGRARPAFLQTLDQHLSALCEALEAGDVRQLETAAAALKDLSLKAESNVVADHAMRVQLAARSGDLSEAASVIRKLQDLRQSSASSAADTDTSGNHSTSQEDIEREIPHS